MTRRPKTPQYKEFNHRPDCFGRWQQHEANLADWRRPDQPLMVEIGAGRGRISLEFARTNPAWQVLAVDLKSDRLNQAARQSSGDSLALLQAHVDQLADYLALEHQANLIWLAFPDPQPKPRQLKHRLTSPERLDQWQQLLVPGGRLRLKTDHVGFFVASRQLLATRPGWELTAVVDNLPLAGDYPVDVLTPTAYETRFRAQGRPIYYLEARTRPNRGQGGGVSYNQGGPVETVLRV